MLAERAGLRIHEVPVDWIDDPDSRVDIVSTAIADLKGIARLAKGLAMRTIALPDLRRQALERDTTTATVAGRPTKRTPMQDRLSSRPADAHRPTTLDLPGGLPRQLLRFILIGVISTLAYLVLFSLLRIRNDRSTGQLRGATNDRDHEHSRKPQGHLRHHRAPTTPPSPTPRAHRLRPRPRIDERALGALHAISATPAKGLELTVLVTANLAATVLRFVAAHLALPPPPRRRWLITISQWATTDRHQYAAGG